MSERGSFVTEYVYCGDCFAVLKDVLLRERDSYMAASVIPTWDIREDASPDLPIIAGKIGALGPWGEALTLDSILQTDEARLCHPVHIIIVHDGGLARTTVWGPPCDVHDHSPPDTPSAMETDQ